MAGQKSRIETLSEDLRVKINEALRRGVYEKDILAAVNAILEERGEDPVSKSSLNRYKLRARKLDARLKRAQKYADRFTANLSESAKTTDFGQAANQLLKGLVIDKMLEIEGEDEDAEIAFSVDDIKKLATAQHKLAQASALDLDRVLKIKEVARREALEEAANNVEAAAKQTGLNADQAKFMRKSVLMGLA